VEAHGLNKSVTAAILQARACSSTAPVVGLERLLDNMAQRSGVWVTRRIDIARHWIAAHPYSGKGLNE